MVWTQDTLKTTAAQVVAQSLSTTVLLRTTLTRTITLDKLLSYSRGQDSLAAKPKKNKVQLLWLDGRSCGNHSKKSSITNVKKLQTEDFRQTWTDLHNDELLSLLLR